MKFPNSSRSSDITISTMDVAIARNATPTETFDHYLFDATVPDYHRGGSHDASEVQEYRQIRSQMPQSLLGMIPDFVHEHGQDFVFKHGPDGPEISGYGHSPKASLLNASSDGFDHENADVLVAMGGGSKLVHASRSLGLLVTGGGRLDVHVGTPSLVRLIHSGGGDVCVGNKRDFQKRNTMSEFLLNATSFDEVESGIVVVYLGGGEVSLTSEPTSGHDRLAHTAPPQLGL